VGFYNKPSRAMLLDAINQQNGLMDNPLTWDQIASGYPEEVSTPGADRNTRVLLYGITNAGYRGNVAITYNRIQMPILFQNIVPVVVTDPVQKLSDLLPFLNDKYGLSLTADDVEDFSVADKGESWLAEVSIRPGSLAWQGVFRLRYAKFFPNLSDVITDVDLTAIVAPFTVGDKPHAEYVAYGYDWTDLQKVFEETWSYNRLLTTDDVDRLNEVVPLGFTIAPAETAKADEISLFGARFMGTAAVTDTGPYNPDYRRVAVIKLATTSNYTGSLYLHYSPK